MNDSGGADIFGMLSLVCGVIGLFGQFCCCIPFVSILAMVVVPMCMLLGLVFGGVGVATGMTSGRGTALSWMGLALNLFDIAFLCLWYGTLVCGYLGLVVASGAAGA